jgi:hypothetical protein
LVGRYVLIGGEIFIKFVVNPRLPIALSEENIAIPYYLLAADPKNYQQENRILHILVYYFIEIENRSENL